ncbi:MAG: uracil-DNA glycosylase [Candidatus Saccharimonadales bacterium]
MNKYEELKKLNESWQSCQRCELAAGRQGTNPVFGSGNLDSDIVAIGSKVSYYDAEIGRPMQGNVGLILDKLLETAGLRREQIYLTNLTICCIQVTKVGKLGKTEIPDPVKKHIRACQPRLLAEINIIRPKLLVLMGNIPAHYVVGYVPKTRRWLDGNYGPWKVYYTLNPASAKEGHGNVNAHLAEMKSHWKEIAEWLRRPHA